MITPLECYNKYGLSYNNENTPTNENLNFERRWMVLWDVPADINLKIPTIPNKIYCNKDMVLPLEKAFRNIIANGLEKELITWDGCFNLRPMRGYEIQFKAFLFENKIIDAIKYMSIHCWAVAIDLNAAWNQLRMKPTLSDAFVKCFTDAGFDWGGHWKSRLDGMHMQLGKI